MDRIGLLWLMPSLDFSLAKLMGKYCHDSWQKVFVTLNLFYIFHKNVFAFEKKTIYKNQHFEKFRQFKPFKHNSFNKYESKTD